jgi:hypothetical protein
MCSLRISIFPERGVSESKPFSYENILRLTGADYYFRSWFLLCTLAPLFYVNSLDKSSVYSYIAALFFWASNVLSCMIDAKLIFPLPISEFGIFPTADVFAESKLYKTLFHFWSWLMLIVLIVMGVLMIRYVSFFLNSSCAHPDPSTPQNDLFW